MIEEAYHKLIPSTNSTLPKNKIVDTDVICPSSTSRKFLFTICETAKGISVHFEWISKSKHLNPLNVHIINALVDHFGNAIYRKEMIGYTELKHGKRIYQVDGKYKTKGSWNDNVLVSWENNKKQKRGYASATDETEVDDLTNTLVPAEMKMCFQLKNESTYYCIVHSCHYQYAQQLVLSTMWLKEYENVPTTMFNHFREMDETTLIIGHNPIYQVVKMNTVHSHCLLVPYHSLSCFFLLISNPNTWANEFHHIP